MTFSHPGAPFTLGYTDVMPRCLEAIVSRDNPNLYLQYWPKEYQVTIDNSPTCTREFLDWTAGRAEWTDIDRKRHEDEANQEMIMRGWQPDPQRRLAAMKFCETLYHFDDVGEKLICSGDEVHEAMGLHMVAICRDMLAGRSNDAEICSRRYDQYPSEVKLCQDTINMYRDVYQDFKKLMSPRLLKLFQETCHKSFNVSLDEHALMKETLASNRYITLQEFNDIKSVTSFIVLDALNTCDDEDVNFFRPDNSMMIMTSLVAQILNEYCSYAKDNHIHCPFNTLQGAMVSDKMTLEQALMEHINRKNEYVRAFEVALSILPSEAEKSAVKAMKMMCGWEYFQTHSTRYGWTCKIGHQ
ncbi:hypothetical protein HDE_01457 [Halotydeus destructor]|nr:hypothetical protein HDE_01457 [Halotydeus destructor]